MAITERRFHRAFVIGAYQPNGGTLMAYHLGRILDRDFGIHAVAVRMDDESADHGIYAYDLNMPLVSWQAMEQDITDADILIVNPSFSGHRFGGRLPGFKFSYVQGFSTYSKLDLEFDCYIAVSDFVASYLRSTYTINAPVIPPFINLDGLPDAPQWEQRPANVMLSYRKSMPEFWELSWQKLRQILSQHAPQITLTELVLGNGIRQSELLAKIGGVRYFLTLSAAEGFGLVPLEAMAMGTMVIGYDGFGGRQYMRPNENCSIAPFPKIERVAELAIAAVGDPERSAQMARRGRETAAGYSYAAFRRAWIEQFSAALQISPLVQ